MDMLENWRTQVRKGYLELCILALIRRHERLYGFDLLERLREAELPLKEGTLYPLLNRMSADGTLAAKWETDAAKGHPRKFYSLTREGAKLLDRMAIEFEKMIDTFRAVARD